MKSVLVAGAGISGLTLAFLLKRSGYAVTLVESSARVGGSIETLRKDGYLAELGPSSILESCTEIGELIEMIGLEGERLPASRDAKNRYIVKSGAPTAAPSSPGTFFSTPLFSARGKARLFAEPFIAPSAPDAVESVSSFVERRLGRELLDYAVNPFVAGVYAGNPDRLAVRHAFPKLWALEQEGGSIVKGVLKRMLSSRKKRVGRKLPRGVAKIFSFKSGIETMTTRLAEQLEGSIMLGADVASVSREGAGWVVRTVSAGREAESRHDLVVFAVPSHRLTKVKIGAGADAAIEAIAGMDYPTVAVLSLGFRASSVRHPLDGYGALAPELEKRRILGVLFPSSIFPARAPQGCALLTVYIGGARNPEMAMKSEEELTRISLEELDSLLGLGSGPEFTSFHRVERAIPQYGLDYGVRLAAMKTLEAMNPGIFVAGTQRGGISVGDAIRSSFELVERIRGHCPA